jgi:hypothetical protein
VDGSDQWWMVLAAGALIVGCYLAGRRGHVGAAVAVLGAAEAATAAALVARHGAAAWLAEQVAIVAALFAMLAGAYRRQRYELALRGWEHARDAGLRERARIAAELHDTLGHDLALLALQAAGIQVTTAEPATREQAAAIRAGAAEATATVRRLVDLLRAEPGVAAVIDRARAAGMAVTVVGDPPADEFSSRLVTEALSNVARHAPDTPVTVTFGADRRLEVCNGLPDSAESVTASATGSALVPGGDGRRGTGLATFAAQLAAVGGRLTAGPVDGQFRLVATVPADVDRRIGRRADPIDHDYRSHRRRARTVLTTALVAPLALLVLITTGFYAWATHDTTLEAAGYRRLAVGMPEAAAAQVLPPRQAHVRLAAQHRPDCRYYTDGNYPLAYATYEVCFRDGRVSRLVDHSGGTG